MTLQRQRRTRSQRNRAVGFGAEVSVGSDAPGPSRRQLHPGLPQAVSIQVAFLPVLEDAPIVELRLVEGARVLVDAAEEVEAPGVEEGPPEVLDLAFGGALELPLSTRRMSASEVGRSQRVPDREMLRVVGLARVTFRQGALSREVVVPPLLSIRGK